MKSDRYLSVIVPYTIAALVGLAAAFYAVPAETFGGWGGMFAHPDGDLNANLIGHLAFQRPGWHWPLLRAPAMALPRGEAISFSDSNPALSLIAKILASLRGRPANLFGLWIAACIALQPVGAVFALRGLLPRKVIAWTWTRGAVAPLAAALLALAVPCWLYRIGHINLFAHVLLLAALGLAARWCRDGAQPRAGPAFALLAAAILVHPYLYIFCAIVLAAPALNSAARNPDRRSGLVSLALSALLAAGLILLLSGGAGGNGPGYGLYSLNLLGPFWPQASGLFGASLPVLDATGYQYEGYNYLGLGALLLVGTAAVMLAVSARRRALPGYRGLILIMVALTLLAVTPRLTAGGSVLLAVDLRFADPLLGHIRASGRAFWVVAYALMLGSIAVLATRLTPFRFASFLALVIALQWLDCGPLRRQALNALAGRGQVADLLPIPAGTALYRTVPPCGPDGVHADTYRLQALRLGARLADARLAHEPTEEECATRTVTGLTDAMQPGEARLFLPDVAARVHPDAINAACQATRDGLLCLPKGS